MQQNKNYRNVTPTKQKQTNKQIDRNETYNKTDGTNPVN
jgi:hypothetical protein